MIDEKPLKDNVRAVLGDPNISKSIKLPVHSAIIASLKTYMAKGLPTDDKQKLLEKYAVAEDIAAPIRNTAIATKLKKSNPTLKSLTS